MKLIDYYEMVLSGEDYDTLCCPEQCRKAIERFRLFESEPNEWIIRAKTGLHVRNIRNLQKIYCIFHNLPSPVKNERPVKYSIIKLRGSAINRVVEKPAEKKRYVSDYLKREKFEPLRNDKVFNQESDIQPFVVEKEDIGKTYYFSTRGLYAIPVYSKR